MAVATGPLGSDAEFARKCHQALPPFAVDTNPGPSRGAESRQVQCDANRDNGEVDERSSSAAARTPGGGSSPARVDHQFDAPGDSLSVTGCEDVPCIASEHLLLMGDHLGLQTAEEVRSRRGVRRRALVRTRARLEGHRGRRQRALLALGLSRSNRQQAHQFPAGHDRAVARIPWSAGGASGAACPVQREREPNVAKSDPPRRAPLHCPGRTRQRSGK